MADALPVVAQFRQWQRESVGAARFSCAPIPMSAAREWSFQDGILRHRSFGFFALAGVVASAREPPLDGHQQLIILQPQIAINGFLLHERAGRPHLLFHGRLEPGNVGGMQLAPTVQSTPANYERVHGGRPTPFVEYFLDASRGETVIDTLQSEQATRYHGKYNRNVVVRPGNGEPEIPAQFRWYDLDAIRAFAHADNVLNTDARSVLACLPWRALGDNLFGSRSDYTAALRRSYLATEDDKETPDREVFAWLSHRRARLGLRTRILPVSELAGWVADETSIREMETRLGFAARMYRVVAHGREVDEWDQPLVVSRGPGRIALFTQLRRGVLKFLVKASAEIGFLEGVQLGPSISIPPGHPPAGHDPVEARLLEWGIDASRCVARHRSLQSEEGGRFYQDENEYALLELDGGVSLPPDDAYRWLTLAQIRELLPISGMFSMEFRAALSLVLGHA